VFSENPPSIKKPMFFDKPLWITPLYDPISISSPYLLNVVAVISNLRGITGSD